MHFNYADISKVIRKLNGNNTDANAKIFLKIIKTWGKPLCKLLESTLEIVRRDSLLSSYKKANIIPIHKKNYRSSFIFPKIQ